MKPKVNKNDEIDSKKLFFETSRDLGFRAVVYTVLAIVVFVTGKFFWWAGFILFLILGVNLLSELLLNGFVLLVAVFTTVVYAFAYLKLKANDKPTKKLDDFSSILWINLPSVIFCSYLLILGCLLFAFFFQEFL